MKEKDFTDAPLWMSANRASAWADGYNKALDEAKDLAFDIQPLTQDNLPDDWHRPIFLWRADAKRWEVCVVFGQLDTLHIGHPQFAYTHWCYFDYPPNPES